MRVDILYPFKPPQIFLDCLFLQLLSHLSFHYMPLSFLSASALSHILINFPRVFCFSWVTHLGNFSPDIMNGIFTYTFWKFSTTASFSDVFSNNNSGRQQHWSPTCFPKYFRFLILFIIKFYMIKTDRREFLSQFSRQDHLASKS